MGAGEGNRIWHLFSAPCATMQCRAAYKRSISSKTARHCTQLKRICHQLSLKTAGPKPLRNAPLIKAEAARRGLSNNQDLSPLR